jgi:hypothetical protein
MSSSKVKSAPKKQDQRDKRDQQDERLAEIFKSLNISTKYKSTDPIKPPEVIVTGTYNGSTIKVYGELHTDIDNRFYKNLDLNIDNMIIMVEYPNFDKYKMTKSNIDNYSKTSEGCQWVWYKYSSERVTTKDEKILKTINDNFHCIDIREEIGLLTVAQEMYLRDMNDNSDIEKILIGCAKCCKVFTSPNIKKMFIGEELEDIYASYIDMMDRQYHILEGIRDFNEPGVLDTKDNLVFNIVKMSSLIVDLHIYKTIIQLKLKPENKNKDIAIFVGCAHAYRLHKLFPKVFTHMKTSYTQEKIKELNMDCLLAEDIMKEYQLLFKCLEKGIM